MIQTVKKVLVFGIIFGLLGIFSGNANAQINRYECSRFNDRISECWLSNKCKVDTINVENSLGETTEKKVCVPKTESHEAERIKQNKVLAAQSQCEKTSLEYSGDTRFNPAEITKLKAVCIQAASTSEKACEEQLNPKQTEQDSRGNENLADDTYTRSLFRKFKRACKEDALNRLKNAEAKLTAEEAVEYAPFGVYEGPSFSGPGLKAGSRIAKSKIDNTISKEKSIKKLAIGWVNFALSLVAILAVIAVIYAGILYVTSMGDDGNKEKAKNIIIYVAAGILLIFGSYAIVKALLTASGGGVNFSNKSTKSSIESIV